MNSTLYNLVHVNLIVPLRELFKDDVRPVGYE